MYLSLPPIKEMHINVHLCGLERGFYNLRICKFIADQCANGYSTQAFYLQVSEPRAGAVNYVTCLTGLSRPHLHLYGSPVVRLKVFCYI